ncbi:MAG TPA: ATP phosphoribosyltransferase [Candidatus Brocadiia bacterium]|nr:ATP phosphoribosyltransferase [Candidatus Brocadiia bacterium]
MSNTLSIGLPIGSLEQATLDMMARAGFNVYVPSRSYYPVVDDEEIKARRIRPQDMSRFVERQIVDCGITGNDWIAENGSDIHVVGQMQYNKQTVLPYRWVIAVPEASPIQTVADLQGKRIATELVNVATKFLASHNVKASVEFSHGATEAKAPDIVDAIMDGTETGSSLRANKLRIVAEVMTSYTQFIASRPAWADPWKRAKIESLYMLFQGAIAARLKVGLKLNAGPNDLEAILKILPAMKKPTVSPLAENAGFALETIVDESVVRKIIPQLKRAGATGIVEYPLNKVIP